VTSAVRAPTRADAAAASVPAWPPPITMTSKEESEAMKNQVRKVEITTASRGGRSKSAELLAPEPGFT
jgi:hypothetical protein